jgi:hypothetical protein
LQRWAMVQDKAKNMNLLYYFPQCQKFSLRSNYNYRSNNLFAAPAKKEFIMLNPVVTYQTGNSAYIVPLKKLPLMGKIKFTTTPQKF